MAQGGNVFENSSQSLLEAMQGTQNAAGIFQQLAQFNPALLGNPTQMQAAQVGAAPGYQAAMASGPSAIHQQMGNYQNPWQSQVMDSAAAQIERARKMQQLENSGAAHAAGAFGGSRHGIVESLTNEAALRQTGDIAGQLGMQGFNTAAGLAGQDIANQMQTGFANQNAANQAGQFNTGLMGQFALANQQAQQQANQINAGVSNQFALANQAAQNATPGFLAQAGQGLLGAAGMGGSLANTGTSIGLGINEQQWEQGGRQQAMQQALYDYAQNAFGGYANQGNTMLDLLNHAISVSPLNNAISQTTSNTPGLFDYLSLGAGTATAGKGGK